MINILLPIRGTVIHQELNIPFYIDNPNSILALKEANKNKSNVILTPQKNWKNNPVSSEDLYNIGTIAEISQFVVMPDDVLHLVIKTVGVVNIKDITNKDGIFFGNIRKIKMKDKPDSEEVVLLKNKLVEYMQSLSGSYKFSISKIKNIASSYSLPALIDYIVVTLNISLDIAVKILSLSSWKEKLILLLEQLSLFIETSKIEDNINKRINQQMQEGRREAILQEKMRAIQKEMGDSEDEKDTVNLKKRIDKVLLSKEAKEKALSELKKLRHIPSSSPDSGLIKNYLDELLSLPWGIFSESNIDLKEARNILNSDHFGMFEAKERILEHIAVMKKTKSQGGSILCLVGAPGVGKTSLAKSISDALGRKYQRLALGGVSDEAFFRGHRRTYIGSQPGRIIDALKRSKTSNPVIVLDEIDKLGSFGRGDPEAALLEILDPEQNKTFRDHFIEVDFDLSKVLFIATANSLNITQALKDRMEIIEIPPYTNEEKIEITKRHLINKAALDTGFDENNIIIKEDAINYMISNFTNEQGVRELKRTITSLLRKTLLKNDGEDVLTEFNKEKIDELLNSKTEVSFGKKIGFGIRY